MDLAWVDEFILNVRPYIYVREEDSLLIRMPNRAHRLNAQGVKVLRYLLNGGTMEGICRGLKGDKEKIRDVGLFLYEVKRSLEGKLKENNYTGAVEVRPLEIGFSRLPILAEVAMTHRCNLRCSFCYYGCGSACSGKSEKREMSASEVGRVLEIIYHEAKTPSVSFTGGEPALRRDLPDLVRRAKNTGLRVNLITNGTLVTPVLARRLLDAGLDSAQVSLEGVTAATHDAITGVPGSFVKTLAAVKSFCHEGVTVHTNTTLNRANLSDVLRLPAFIREELELQRFSMNLVIPSGDATASQDGGGSILVHYEDTGRVVEAVLAESERHGVEFMWYSPTPLCMFNPIVHGLGNKGCSACDGLLSVDCNGDVLPCSSWSEPVGNLLEQEFSEIWDSAEAGALRQKSFAHPVCKGCSSFAVCHGACPLYWRHFGFGELEKTVSAGSDSVCPEMHLDLATSFGGR